MKKLPIVILAALGVAGLSYTGASWYAGKQAEITLAKQHKLLADLPYFVVKSHDYQRGIFSSHERTTIALNPTLTQPYMEVLSLAGKEMPNLQLTYEQTISHGPFPLLSKGGFSLLKAHVVTDVQFSADTQKWLTKVFGEQKPLQIENRIQFNDDGVFAVKIPSFTYEETLAKVKSVWQGLDVSLAYGGDFNRVDINALAPGLKFEAGPKGSLEIKELRFESHNQRGKAGLMLGDGKLTLASASLQRKEVAEGEEPLDVKLDGVAYQVKTSETGDFINSSGDISMKTLAISGKSYGPAKLSVAANHLHGPTLFKLSQAVTKIQREPGNPTEQANKMLDTFRKDGLPLLRNDPALSIKELSVKLPEGEVVLHADLALKGFKDEDLNQPLKLLERLQAHADLKVPKQVIETFALWKARGMIATDTAEGEHPDPAELDNLARNLMESQISKLTEQKLIKVEGDVLSSSADWKQGQLSINNNPVPMPWQAGQPPK
ncbi:YdgA family protein [Chitinimonas sp.]|uniref:YdgA family protein n=1 Tax=Chitinimonas sp. TaxID=1934313 RepID=UPI0035B1B5A8